MTSQPSALDRAVVALLPAVPRTIVARASGRYIAGSTLDDACRVVQKLSAVGRLATLDVLGEEAASFGEVTAIGRQYGRALDAIVGKGLDANVSIKPTAFGLELDPERCFEQVARLVEQAGRHGLLVRLDMEDSSTTTAILDLYRRLRAEGHANTGPVLQAALRRTPDDVAALAGESLNIRLCKGIYLEPASVAHVDTGEIRRAYTAVLEQLLGSGAYVAIATHDERLTDAALRLIARLGLGKDRYEFQMLLGVRPKLGDELVREGHRLRIYVPYGERWYEYSLRRLRENPRVARHVLRALGTRATGSRRSIHEGRG